MFLKNELANGNYEVEGRPVSLSNIRAPMFVVSTEKDHVAPWRSVFKIHLQADAPITFVLTSGGHNAGIISEPGHPRRHYRVATRDDTDGYIDPDTPAFPDAAHPSPWSSWGRNGCHGLERSRAPELVDAATVGNGGRCGALWGASGSYVLAK